MPEVIIVGSLKARAGQEDAVRDALAELVMPTHAEDGCILYAVHQGIEDPARFAIIERWRSQEAHDAHVGSVHMTAVIARAGELLAELPDGVHYNALPYGESAKGSLAGCGA